MRRSQITSVLFLILLTVVPYTYGLTVIADSNDIYATLTNVTYVIKITLGQNEYYT